MSALPYVHLTCPHCGEDTRVYAQEFGEFDFPELVFRQDAVPLEVAKSLDRQTVQCDECRREFKINAVIPFIPKFTNIWGTIA